MPNAPLHVAAAIIVNAVGEVLISRRHAHVHQGGLWEFPGGKLEPGEAVQQALRRELDEELGIHVTRARPLIRIPYHYPEQDVLLDVWRVEAYTGEPHGREGQPLAWVEPDKLQRQDFPPANGPIITAAQLPDRYLITPDPAGIAVDTFLEHLVGSLQRGIKLVQLRAPSLTEAGYVSLAARCLAVCRAQGARLLLNAEPRLIERLGADGVHLNSRRLMALRERPLPAPGLVAASCHDRHELARAEQLGLDFCVLSPVQATESHPDATPIGWPAVATLVARVSLPVYALGGLNESDLPKAWEHGVQGVAAMRGLWGGLAWGVY